MNNQVIAMLDELEKIAAALSEQDQRRQMLQFGVLGAASAPVISGIGKLIETGHVVPKGVTPGRWLGASMVTGALAGGAMPILRHRMERKNIEEARARNRMARGLG